MKRCTVNLKLHARANGAVEIESAPWILIFPAAFLAVTLFCFNFVGDGMRDALDPKLRGLED